MMDPSIVFIGIILLVAIVYVFAVMVGSMFEATSDSLKMSMFSMFIVIGTIIATYFNPHATTADVFVNSMIGAGLILTIAAYIYIPWGKIPTVGKIFTIGVVFATFAAALIYASPTNGMHAAISSAQIFAITGVSILLVYFISYSLVYAIHTFDVTDWIYSGLGLFGIFATYILIGNAYGNRQSTNLAGHISTAKGFVNSTYSLMTIGNMFETKLLAIEAGIIVLYFIVVPRIHAYVRRVINNQNGKLIINGIVPLYPQQDVSSYMELTRNASPGYKYAISFWVYIDSVQQSNHATVDILSYGNNPIVQYTPSNNTMIIKSKQGNLFKTLSMIQNVPLQKWNHIVLNYVNGTLDVFYNGVINSSNIDVNKYIPDDVLTIGTSTLFYGNIGNLLYFEEPISNKTVAKLYNLNRP